MPVLPAERERPRASGPSGAGEHFSGEKAGVAAGHVLLTSAARSLSRAKIFDVGLLSIIDWLAFPVAAILAGSTCFSLVSWVLLGVLFVTMLFALLLVLLMLVALVALIVLIVPSVVGIIFCR